MGMSILEELALSVFKVVQHEQAVLKNGYYIVGGQDRQYE
jgi:hypothetical protein